MTGTGSAVVAAQEGVRAVVALEDVFVSVDVDADVAHENDALVSWEEVSRAAGELLFASALERTSISGPQG